MLIAPTNGTRHTSARRFSFDEPSSLVIVVSEDGPTTVYSDGATTTVVRTDACRVGDLGNSMHSRAMPDPAGETHIVCPVCVKPLLVDEMRFDGWTGGPDQQHCPVCDALVVVDAYRAAIRGVAKVFSTHRRTRRPVDTLPPVCADLPDLDPPQREVPLSLTIASLSVIHRRVFSERLRCESWIAAAGLRPGCYGVLSSIDALQPASQAQISVDRQLDPSDVVGIVDILERAGFVTRERDATDRRKYSLTLTPEGESALDRLNVIADQVQDAIFAPLNARDRATFDRLLQRLVGRHAAVAREARKG